MTQIIDQDSVRLGNIGGLKRNPAYQRADFKKSLVENYTKLRNYAAVARVLNDEFKTNIMPTEVKYLLINSTSEELKAKTPNEQKEVFVKAFSAMNKRWDKSLEMLDWLNHTVEKVQKQIDESGDDKLAIQFMKLSPTILSVIKENREQIGFIREQTNEILDVTNNNVLDATQINYYIGEEFAKLEKEKLKSDAKLNGMEVIEDDI